MEDIKPLEEIKFELDQTQETENKPKTETDAMVESAFNQAIKSQVLNNKEIQEELLISAEQTIKNKTEVLKNEAEQESKEAHFNNRKDACECFGYSEKTTEKWAVNYMNAWHNVFTAIWVTIGMFTFAPITFIGAKLKVIFKKTWVAMVVSITLYLGIAVGIPILIAFLKNKGIEINN